MNQSLRGARVLVTRPAEQADDLCGLIEAAGGRALRLPLLEIVAQPLAPVAVEAALNADWLIFISKNAVDFALQAFSGKMVELSKLALAAVGGATAARLTAAGLTVACVPASDFSSEGLLAEAAMQQVSGQRCVIVRGVGGREKLARTLSARGARVDYLEVYRRLPPREGCELNQWLQQQCLDALIVTSGEALRNMVELLSAPALIWAQRLPLLVVSDRMAEEAAKFGFERILTSRQPSDAAILETLNTLFDGENSGRSN